MTDTVRPRRYVLLDRDGVLNVERGEYTTTVDEWQWVPGAIEGVRRLTEAGFGVIVVTNQACIARGLQTEAGLERLHGFMRDGIRKGGGDILEVYHCPHDDADCCPDRKPEPGLLLRAAADYGIRLAETFMVGDSTRDMEAARRAGARTILIEHPANTKPKQADIEAEFRARDLVKAADIVIRETPARE